VKTEALRDRPPAQRLLVIDLAAVFYVPTHNVLRQLDAPMIELGRSHPDVELLPGFHPPASAAR
jgi:hypothetical protein